MNTKKYITATISGLVVMFLLSWLGHEVIIKGLLESNPMETIERESPLYVGAIAAYLVMALLMAYIYPRGIEGESVFGNGIRFGVLIGLLVSLPISLILYSTITTASFSRVIMEAVWHMIEQGAGGIAIAYAFGIETHKSESVEQEGSPDSAEDHAHGP